MNERSAHYLAVGFNRVQGWLSPTTAHIMMALADQQRLEGIAGDLAEIGVYHGKSFLALANSVAPSERIFAIDVFEDQHKNLDRSGSGSRKIFLSNVATYAPGTPLEIIQQSSLDLSAMGWPQDHADSIRFFSIDGSHTRAATLNDLKVAEQTAKAGAIIAVDDILSSHWLGVISGVFDYLSYGGELIPFALVPNKMLFVKDRRFKPKWTEFIRQRYARSIAKCNVKFRDEPLDVVEEDTTLASPLAGHPRRTSLIDAVLLKYKLWRSTRTADR